MCFIQKKSFTEKVKFDFEGRKYCSVAWEGLALVPEK